MPKEELQTRVLKILESKPFTQEVKSNILEYFEAILEKFHPPSFLNLSINDYLNRYFKVLEKLTSFKVYTANDINDLNDPVAKVFRDDMIQVSESQGSYELTATGFIASSRGNYECTTLAFAKRATNEINTLEISNPNERINTYHHELTHLTEGANPFLFPSSLPFSYEIRKCLVEGRASFNEDLLKLEKNMVKWRL